MELNEGLKPNSIWRVLLNKVWENANNKAYELNKSVINVYVHTVWDNANNKAYELNKSIINVYVHTVRKDRKPVISTSPVMCKMKAPL